MDIEVFDLTAADLARGTARDVFFGAGSLHEPVLIVDLDNTDAATAADAASRVAARDGVAVGSCSGPVGPELAPLTGALDLTYAATPDPADLAVIGSEDKAQALAEFVAGMRRNPQAAGIAAQVLRASANQPVFAAIDTESFAYSALQGGAEFGAWLDGRRRLGRPLPPPPVADPVLVTAEGKRLRITLNRPERRNAYGTALRDALVDALRIAALTDTFTEVVVDGAGPAFCAGGDLDEFGYAPDTATAHLIRTRGGAARWMARLADRTAVLLHGPCVGAGIEIAAFADRVSAAGDTVVRFPEVSMGLIPGAGGTVSVPRRIGRWRALHLFVTGAELNARRAHDWGLVDEVR